MDNSTAPQAAYTQVARPLGRPELLPAIKNYADLLVRKGCALKPGQELAVNAPVEAAAFARICVDSILG